MELILTLDVGTTSVKACLFDRRLRQTALTSREYALRTHGVCAEAEPQIYLDAAAQCILSLPAEARARVCAVALTTQGETLICVDRQGRALRPAIVWLDSRAEAQAARLAAVLDRQRFYERTGLPELSGALPLAKLLWLREREPEIWARTDKFLLLEDYLMLWLTGRAVTEKSLLTSTGYFDLQSDDYWDEALALAEQWNCRPMELTRSSRKQHIFTHIQWDMTGYYIRCAAAAPQLEWADAARMAREISLPTAFRQFLMDGA